MRVCDVCGGPLPLQTGRGGRRKRHPECTKRRTRARLSPVSLERRPEHAASVYETTRRAIDEVGVSADPLASLALALASRIDGDQEPGAALASLSKQLRETLAVILNRAATDGRPDPIEEIRERLRRRGS